MFWWKSGTVSTDEDKKLAHFEQNVTTSKKKQRTKTLNFEHNTQDSSCDLYALNFRWVFYQRSALSS